MTFGALAQDDVRTDQRVRFGIAAVILCVLAAMLAALSPTPTGLTDGSPGDVAYGELPLAFEPAAPGTGHGVDYTARGPGYSAFLAGTETTLALDPQDGKGIALQVGLPGAHPGPAVAEAKLPGEVNHLVGAREDWRTGVPTYERIRYPDAWPGVDVAYYGNQGRLEYDFEVAAGADPSRIALQFAGQEELRIAANGDLVLAVPGPDLRQQAPLSYQERSDGQHIPVTSAYEITGKDKVGIDLGRYDRSRPLVIDPLVLTYSTYLGGASTDSANGVDVDSSGAAYVTGTTESLAFPTTLGAFDTTYTGVGDVFVSKLNPAGTALEYSTFIGGAGQDLGNGIAVDDSGNVYITGATAPPGAGAAFPTTAGAYDTTLGGIQDVFVTKLNAGGATLGYSTLVGGPLGSEFGQDVTVDSTGAAYVGATAISGGTGFPTTGGAFDPTQNGGAEVVAFKLNPAGSTLAYSTFVSGNNTDSTPAISVEADGSALVTGSTTSADFPTTAGAFDTTSGGADGFATKLNPAGSGLEYSTYIGGGAADSITENAIDAAGHAYLVGDTFSNDYPATPGAFDTTFNTNRDLVVTKMSADGSGLVYSTFIGGTGFETGTGIAVDSAGAAHISGNTNSTNNPVVASTIQPTLGGGTDGFVAKLRPDGSALRYATYLGGSGNDTTPGGIAVDGLGAAYVAGGTPSGNFPTTPTAVDPTANGGFDGWVAKLTAIPDADLELTKSDTPDPVDLGDNVTYTLTVENHGPDSAPGVEIVDTLPASVDFVSASPGCVHAAGVVTCTTGAMTNGATENRQIVVKTKATGTITNNATVTHTGTDPASANDSASEDTYVQASDLSLSKSGPSEPVDLGDEFTYTLTAQNNGPDAASGVVLTDILPSSLSFVSASPGCSHAAGTVTCNIGTIANGASASVQIVVTASQEGAISNTAGASHAGTDPTPNNDTATTSVNASLDFDTIIVKAPVTVNFKKTILRYRAIEDGFKSPRASFRCKLDRPGDKGSFKPCKKPQFYRKLKPGEYHFEVFAISSQGFVDETPAEANFTVDPPPKLRHTNRTRLKAGPA